MYTIIISNSNLEQLTLNDVNIFLYNVYIDIFLYGQTSKC